MVIKHCSSALTGIPSIDVTFRSDDDASILQVSTDKIWGISGVWPKYLFWCMQGKCGVIWNWFSYVTSSVWSNSIENDSELPRADQFLSTGTIVLLLENAEWVQWHFFTFFSNWTVKPSSWVVFKHDNSFGKMLARSQITGSQFFWEC